MTYRELYAQFQARCASDPLLRSLRRKITGGTADLRDTAAYSERISGLLGREMSENIALFPPGTRETTLQWLLRDQYEDINSIYTAVQRTLDEAQGIAIEPQRPPFPAERVQTVAHALEDPTVPEDTIRRRADAPAAAVSKSFHDDCIRTNAALRNDLGLKPTLTRIASAKACPWCAEVSGKWRFGEQPDDVFRRHDNCDCTIIYDTQVLRGAGTADGGRSRTWEEVDPSDLQADPPKVLSPEEAEKLQNSVMQELTLARERGILRIEAGSPFKYPKTPLTIDSKMQSKHIRGGKRYSDYMQSHDIEPSYLTISEEKAQELVEKFHGTGILKMNLKGELLPNEIIIDNDEVVGVVVNNLTGAFQETTAFKIQYGPNGTHIVPTYESQKRHYLERRSQNGHDWLLRQKM